MKKTILTFGLISGVLSSVMMAITMPMMHKFSESTGWLVGYASIVLTLSLVYFGIRSYRDNVGGGRITFGRGFAVGICITIISGAFYVATWELAYFNFASVHGMMDGYFAKQIAVVQNSGASAAVMQARMSELAKSRQMYENPLINSAYTFLESFPVGLLITLISAAVLRRKGPAQDARTPITATA